MRGSSEEIFREQAQCDYICTHVNFQEKVPGQRTLSIIR